MKKEIKTEAEGREAEKTNAPVAAFFDLDGTLMPLPSLERRFFRMLRYHRKIRLKNYFLWLREALRLLPGGIAAVMQANKMYLRGVRSFDESGTENPSDISAHKSGYPSQLPSGLGVNRAGQDEGQASIHFRGRARYNPRWPVPCFFEDGVERVTCHAMLGHRIVIVSGTLEPLAEAAARALEAEIAARGFATKIHVCATRLKELNGKWTGEIFGEPRFGPAKARGVCALAKEMELDLSQCWAYSDSAQDRWLLAAVGHPAAVNPSWSLAWIARKQGWALLRWRGGKVLTQCSQRAQRHRDKKEDMREAQTTESLLQSRGI